MEISDWITLAAVIVALAIGVTSLLQTQMLQKRERKERLLNEIIEWAIDINKGGWEVIIPINLALDEDTSERENLARLLFKYQTLYAKSEYIQDIALAFEENLHPALKRVTRNLKEAINRIDEYLFKQKGTKERVEQSNKPLHKSVITLIKEAAKIKTGDIT